MEKVRDDLIDELLKGYEKPEDIVGERLPLTPIR
jgi:hypothetical protein